ncbi:hypothetical protein AB0D97_20795 [Streptomyces roseus]|uniref:hypothetical protein n=1 Tax=Streptomyces roseus TaxID=66430 RepID=UPI00340157B0
MSPPGSSAWSGCFHGAPHLSPAGTRIPSEGWWWHPVGRTVAWTLSPWLTGGTDSWPKDVDWALLPPCEYHWNRPVVWLDEDRLVLGGPGDDEAEIIPGARAFDLRTRGDEDAMRPAEIATFGGHEGRFFAAHGLLFTSAVAGLDIWDPVIGARLGTLAGIRPTHHDPMHGELLELSASGLRRWQTSHATV